jgi:hypothetical protein
VSLPHGGGDGLHMQEFVRLADREFGKRHVVRDSGVVDKDGDGLCRARIGNRLHAGVGAEVSHHGTYLGIRECGHEFLKPVAAPPHQKIVSFGTEALGEGPADA